MKLKLQSTLLLTTLIILTTGPEAFALQMCSGSSGTSSSLQNIAAEFSGLNNSFGISMPISSTTTIPVSMTHGVEVPDPLGSGYVALCPNPPGPVANGCDNGTFISTTKAAFVGKKQPWVPSPNSASGCACKTTLAFPYKVSGANLPSNPDLSSIPFQLLLYRNPTSMPSGFNFVTQDFLNLTYWADVSVSGVMPSYEKAFAYDPALASLGQNPWTGFAPELGGVLQQNISMPGIGQTGIILVDLLVDYNAPLPSAASDRQISGAAYSVVYPQVGTSGFACADIGPKAGPLKFQLKN